MRYATTAALILAATTIVSSPALAQKGPPVGQDDPASPPSSAPPPLADPTAPCEARIALIRSVLDNPVGIDPAAVNLAQQWLERGAFACESHSGPGQSEVAMQMLDVVEEMLGMDEPAAETSMTPVEAGLTVDYLVGEWCYRHESGETGYYVFHPDGTYDLGPVSYRYELVWEGTVGEWMQDIEGVWELQPDRFVLDMGNWRHTYTRGTCG